MTIAWQFQTCFEQGSTTARLSTWRQHIATACFTGICLEWCWLGHVWHHLFRLSAQDSAVRARQSRHDCPRVLLHMLCAHALKRSADVDCHHHVAGRNTCVVVTIRCPWWWWVSLPGPSCLSGPVRHVYPFGFSSWNFGDGSPCFMPVRQVFESRYHDFFRRSSQQCSAVQFTTRALEHAVLWSLQVSADFISFLQCRCVEAPQDTHEASFAQVVFPDVQPHSAVGTCLGLC